MEDFKDNIKNFTIIDAFTKADSIINKYSRIAVSVSGGKDSDIVVDLISSLDKDKNADTSGLIQVLNIELQSNIWSILKVIME